MHVTSGFVELHFWLLSVHSASPHELQSPLQSLTYWASWAVDSEARLRVVYVSGFAEVVPRVTPWVCH